MGRAWMGGVKFRAVKKNYMITIKHVGGMRS
jgi:hypothetical protein